MANLVVCWVYLSFIEHFIVTKPSLRRSNLIQFDSFHTCAHANWLVALPPTPKANNNAATNICLYYIATQQPKPTCRPKRNKQTEKWKRRASNYWRTPQPHTCDSQQSTWFWVWCVRVCVFRLSTMATIYTNGGYVSLCVRVCPRRRNEGHII